MDKKYLSVYIGKIHTRVTENDTYHTIGHQYLNVSAYKIGIKRGNTGKKVKRSPDDRHK